MTDMLLQFAERTLGEENAQSLNMLDYRSIEEFLVNFDAIRSANRISDRALMTLRSAAISQHLPLLRTGSYICRRAMKHTLCLKTHFSSVDKLLNGGIYTNEIVEACGEAGKGKTQFALYAAVHTARKSSQNVLYIDSSNGFSMERLKSVILQTGKPDDEVLKRIAIMPCYDAHSLHNIIHWLAEDKATKNNSWCNGLKLLIIDSIYPLLSPLVGYKSSTGYHATHTLAIQLRKLARDHFIGILIINAAIRVEAPSGLPRAALGAQWQQVADRRILITGFDEEKEDKFDVKVL